tara:strand:- start:50 stop:652 length:603 start_codon:yes stop_codon:yes gene_type:complete
MITTDLNDNVIDNIKSVDYDQHNICLINMRDILSLCETDIFNDLHMFGLFDNFNYKTRDVKKILYHHIIKTICDVYIHQLTFNKVVLYYNEEECTASELGKLGSKHRCGNFLSKTIVKICNLLPIRIFNYQCSFSQANSMIKNGRGEGRDLLQKIKLLFSKKSPKYDFLKVKNFSKRYDLTFLSEQTFNSFFVKYKLSIH